MRVSTDSALRVTERPSPGRTGTSASTERGNSFVLNAAAGVMKISRNMLPKVAAVALLAFRARLWGCFSGNLLFVWRLVKHQQSERALVVQSGEQSVTAGGGLDCRQLGFRGLQSARMGAFQ